MGPVKYRYQFFLRHEDKLEEINEYFVPKNVTEKFKELEKDEFVVSSVNGAFEVFYNHSDPELLEIFNRIYNRR